MTTVAQEGGGHRGEVCSLVVESHTLVVDLKRCFINEYLYLIVITACLNFTCVACESNGEF